jgi:hypothetical protein
MSATPTPTISATVTLTPQPLQTASASPTPGAAASAEELPQAPGTPDGAFVLVTGTAAPRPLVRIHWGAAEPGTYLIKGYRLSRKAADGPWEQRRGAEALAALEWEDLVEVGKAYDYKIQAVDVLGRPGAASAAYHVDLSSLPPALLAPPAPRGLTATSKRRTIALRWDPMPAWLSPLSCYRLYRAADAGGLASAQALTLTGTALELTPTAVALDQWFALQVEDQAGRLSPLSLTVSGRATGALPPQVMGLTATAKVEKAVLNWQASRAGTAPVSAYLLQRRIGPDGDRWRRMLTLAPTALSYSEGLEGGQSYLYRLAAVDAEGNTSAWAMVAVSPSARLLNKAQVMLMPSAYTNDPLRDRGIALGVLFDFYVGSLYESYTDPVTGRSKQGVFQPLQIGTITTDLKYALLDDRGLIPGLAAGLYTSALISFGSGNASTVGVSSNNGGLSTLGDAYAVISKRFWPGEPGAVIHAGLMYGKLGDYMTSDPSPKDWRPTIRHLTPGGDFPSLFTRFVDPKFNATVGQSPHLAFVGLQFPFNVPFYFATWHTALRTELLLPLAWGAEYPARSAASASASSGEDPATMLPWILNLHLDNLPLFGFEFGIVQYPGGMQVIAFYHIPDLSWNW